MSGRTPTRDVNGRAVRRNGPNAINRVIPFHGANLYASLRGQQQNLDPKGPTLVGWYPRHTRWTATAAAPCGSNGSILIQTEFLVQMMRDESCRSRLRDKCVN